MEKTEASYYAKQKHALGASFDIVYGLLEMYDVFGELMQKPVLKLGNNFQFIALITCTQLLKREAIAGVMIMLRGHKNDSHSFTRKAIEIAAFFVEMYSNEESAERWMKAGVSNTAMSKYRSRFPAWKLVDTLLSSELKNFYEDLCLSVHPSYANGARATFDEDGVHRLPYFDEEDDLTWLVVEFLNLVTCHMSIMSFLASKLQSSPEFDQKRWIATLELLGNDLKQIKNHWKEAIEERLKE